MNEAPPLFKPDDAMRVFEGSNGDTTKAFYVQLADFGPAGQIALNLFRAVKCSGRAKVYRRRSHKDEAYRRKQYSLEQLCGCLEEHAAEYGIKWGWKIDPKAEAAESPHKWVLYVEHRHGQCSFHTDTKIRGPEFPGEWDGKSSLTAMLDFVCEVLAWQAFGRAFATFADAAHGHR